MSRPRPGQPMVRYGLLPPPPYAEHHMAMPALDLARTDWTADEIRQLNADAPGDWPRYEVVDGVLLVVRNAPRPLHQAALDLLFRRLDPYVRRHRIGWLTRSPAEIELDGRTLVQPDMFVVPL